jgi:hypothetical protein
MLLMEGLHRPFPLFLLPFVVWNLKTFICSPNMDGKPTARAFYVDFVFSL